jgi:hypothetical protein
MIPDITGESPMVIIITIATRARDIITDIQSALRSMEIAMRDGTSRDIIAVNSETTIEKNRGTDLD